MLSGIWSDGTGGIKGAKMGITQMAQRIKQIHPDYVLIFKVGAFCNTFGKDSYIIASTFDYMIVLNCSYLAMERKNDKEANKLKI